MARVTLHTGSIKKQKRTKLPLPLDGLRKGKETNPIEVNRKKREDRRAPPAWGDHLKRMGGDLIDARLGFSRTSDLEIETSKSTKVRTLCFSELRLSCFENC